METQFKTSIPISRSTTQPNDFSYSTETLIIPSQHGGHHTATNVLEHINWIFVVSRSLSNSKLTIQTKFIKKYYCKR